LGSFILLSFCTSLKLTVKLEERALYNLR
jgi:hypothetical protein